MTRWQVAVLAVGVILLVVAATRGLAVRTTSTGPLVWTVALDQVPQNIAVDTQTHRAFITTVPLGLGVGAGRAGMSMLDTDTGAILRRMVIGGNGNPPPMVDERAGRVLVAASVQVRSGPGVTGIVRVLDARSGGLVRTVTVGLLPRGVAVDEQTGRAFVTSYGFAGAGLVGVLDTRTGRLLRTVDVGMYPHEQIAVDTQQERVFVPVYNQMGDGHVSVLDARTGRPLYTIAAGTAPAWVAVDARTRRAFVIDGSSTALRVFAMPNGHLLRTILIGLHPTLPVVDEHTGRAFVPTAAGVSVLDTRSGAVLRSVAVGRYPGLPVVDARSGRVFVATGNAGQAGSISVLDARSGALIRTVVLGGIPASIAMDERAERVIVVARGLQGAGSVSVLDARSGAILRSVPVGVAGNGMAVVEHTGHVLVLDGPHVVPVPDSWGWLPAWLRRRLTFLPPPGRHSHVVWGVSMIDPRR
jgi:DNA-binding beta-propeller fold protein YncE